MSCGAGRDYWHRVPPFPGSLAEILGDGHDSASPVRPLRVAVPDMEELKVGLREVGRLR